MGSEGQPSQVLPRIHRPYRDLARPRPQWRGRSERRMPCEIAENRCGRAALVWSGARAGGWLQWGAWAVPLWERSGCLRRSVGAHWARRQDAGRHRQDQRDGGNCQGQDHHRDGDSDPGHSGSFVAFVLEITECSEIVSVRTPPARSNGSRRNTKRRKIEEIHRRTVVRICSNFGPP